MRSKASYLFPDLSLKTMQYGNSKNHCTQAKGDADNSNSHRGSGKVPFALANDMLAYEEFEIQKNNILWLTKLLNLPALSYLSQR